ncbi:MAG: hypothetical protein V1897_07235 [Pseudomonadota bacterium]
MSSLFLKAKRKTLTRGNARVKELDIKDDSPMSGSTISWTMRVKLFNRNTNQYPFTPERGA